LPGHHDPTIQGYPIATGPRREHQLGEAVGPTVSSSLVDQPMSSVPGVLTSLTKGALNAATRALAIEHAKNGVRVNAVSAGIIKTSMHSPEIHPFFASLHPMGRMGEISEIVDAILYLESANFITGEILHVDGRQSAGHHAINP